MRSMPSRNRRTVGVAKGYDLFALCDDCNIKYEKSGKLSTRQGMQYVRFAATLNYISPPEPGPHVPPLPIHLPHPLPLVRKRPPRGKHSEPSSCNKRILSRGELELHGTTKKPRQ